jgi:hypothetical protein
MPPSNDAFEEIVMRKVPPHFTVEARSQLQQVSDRPLPVETIFAFVIFVSDRETVVIIETRQR